MIRKHNDMKERLFRLFSLMMALLLFAGCNMPQKVVTPPTDTPEPVVEDTPEPTMTPTPLPQREKIAFIPSDEAPSVTMGLTKALDSICGDVYDCSTISGEDEIDPETNFVIFAKEPTAVSALRERFSNTHLIIVSDPQNIQQGVWTIQYDQAFLPFLAGLAAASNAYDWRSAGLLPSDSVLWGENAADQFANGAHYFCGNCRPMLAPYVNFPFTISLPGDSSPDAWISQFDEAQRSFIYTAFLSDESISQELLQKLITLNVQMLGVSVPPAGLENNWLATINFDWADTLLQIIARTENGETQGVQPLILSIIPGELTEDFSSGKAALLQRAYADLLSGILSPDTPTKEYTE